MFNKIKESFKKFTDSPPEAKVFNQGEYKEDVISYIVSEFKERQRDRLPLELQWRLNLNFVEGNQYMVINPTAGKLEESAPFYYWQERLVYNHIAPIVETRLSKLSRVSPVLKVRPATSDKEDLASAKVSNKILENVFNGLKMRELQNQGNAWAEHTGTCVWKEMWSKDRGRLIGFIGNRELHEGDVDSVPTSPFEIFPDSLFHETVDKCHNIIHAKAYHVRDVKQIWDVEVDGTSVNVLTLKENTYGTGGVGGRGGVYTLTAQTKKDHVLVFEYWEMPTTDYPEGRLVICTESELLYAGINPYKVGQDNSVGLPFTLQKCIGKPGHFFGKSIVERLIPLQQSYNALKNRKKEYLNRCAIGALTYEEGSVDDDFLESEGLAPGAMIPYKQGHQPPSYLQNPPLPHTFETEEAAIMQDFNRISGVSEVSRDSSAPTGVNSGIALAILQEQDDTRLSLTVENIESRVVRAGKMWLRLYKQYAKVPRILKAIGKDNVIEAIKFTGSDIRSDDIYIETSSSLSETPAQRKQFVLDMLGAGLFNDPETGAMDKATRNKVFDMLQMGDWEHFDDETSLQVSRARRENLMMMNGKPAQIKSFDDDIVHIREHNLFRLSADYEELLEENPDMEELVGQHVQEHEMKLQQHLQPQVPEGSPAMIEGESGMVKDPAAIQEMGGQPPDNYQQMQGGGQVL